MILEANAELLEQAADVLAAMDDATYVRPAALFDGQRIGAHVRHVIEFYERLFRGLPAGFVDYDARRRDTEIESDRIAAIWRLRELACSLRDDPSLQADLPLRVSGEGSINAASSLARELQAVMSHTVHHFALIAVLLRYYGLPVPADFGVSKATLEYRASLAAEAA